MPAHTPETEIIFYDGTCALCHRTVQFVLRHDREGKAFRFAPLQGSTFERLVPPAQRNGLPDSIVLRAANGSLLVRSESILHILRRLGGGWKFLAGLLDVIPGPLRDAVYNFIARVRYRVFGRREELCPLVPPEQRSRFDP